MINRNVIIEKNPWHNLPILTLFFFLLPIRTSMSQVIESIDSLQIEKNEHPLKLFNYVVRQDSSSSSRGHLNDSYHTWRLHFEMQLYPNPSNRVVRIHLFPTLQILNVDIRSILGGILSCESKIEDGNNASVDIHNLPDGVYLVVVRVQLETISLPIIVSH